MSAVQTALNSVISLVHKTTQIAQPPTRIPSISKVKASRDTSGKIIDIRTVQELLGHKDVSTTMVYTHVLNRGGKGVLSPADKPCPLLVKTGI